jgi:hypothetical protein
MPEKSAFLGYPTTDSPTGVTDVRYRTSVLGIEHPCQQLLDGGLDNTLLPALQSGTEIAVANGNGSAK